MSAQPHTSPVRGPRHPEHMSPFERTELGSMQPLKFVLNWGRRYSLWLLTFGLPCCGIERRGLFQGIERWPRDSNPRGGCPPTRSPGVPLRPLGQATAVESSGGVTPNGRPSEAAG